MSKERPRLLTILIVLSVIQAISGGEKAIEPLRSALKDKGKWFGFKVKDGAFTSLEKISRRIKNRIVKVDCDC